MFLSKYGVARIIYIPIIKRAVVDFALNADWTPAAGDVKISKDGGAAANVTNLPTAITMGNTAIWLFSLTATEMQAAQVVVTVSDSATKAVEDQSFIIETHGHASAQFQVDLADSVRAGLTALPNATVSGVGGLLTAPTTANVGLADLSRILGTALTETAGQIAAGFKKVFDVAAPVFTASSVNQTGDSFARLGAPAGASVSADVAAVKAVLPAALVSGRIDASVGAMAANVLTATAINADAITDAKVAADVTIASVTGAVGSVTGNVGGNVVGSVASVTAGVTLAASAVQAIWDALTAALTTVGSIGKLLVDNINATISSRLATASYTAPLDAAGTRTAVGLASANLDTQLTTIDDFLDTEVAAIKAKTDNLPAAPAAVSDIPTANANADALLDRAAGIETGLTVRQGFRLWASVLLGKLSGAGTATEVFRDVGDTKARVTATVDASGNRTAITRDAT